MKEYYFHRLTPLTEVLVKIGEASNKSVARMMLKYDRIFLDNQYVDEHTVLEFVKTDKNKKLFRRNKNTVIMKHHSILRIGGHPDPSREIGGRKYQLTRIGAVLNKIEMYK